MPAHDTKYPGETTSRSIRIDSSGLSLNWRNTAGLAVLVLGTLAGTGGYAGLQLVTEAQVDEKVQASETRQTLKIEDLRTEVKENRQAVTTLTVTVDEVQFVQHSDIAIREARRVVDEQIPCKRDDNGCQEHRDLERERVRRLNVSRLKAKKDPCSSLRCD